MLKISELAIVWIRSWLSRVSECLCEWMGYKISDFATVKTKRCCCILPNAHTDKLCTLRYI